MKKSLLTLSLIGLASVSSFAQGQFLFVGSKGATWDAFSASSSQYSSGNVYVSFLINESVNQNLSSIGAATSTNSTQQTLSWSSVIGDANFHFAQNAADNSLVKVLSNTSTLQKGGYGYNGGSTFGVLGTIGGSSYQVIPVAWASAGGADPLNLAANTAFGIGNMFNYSSTVIPNAPSSFSVAGALPFGVAPVPEPTSFALAGIGAAAMMIFRRKK